MRLLTLFLTSLLFLTACVTPQQSSPAAPQAAPSPVVETEATSAPVKPTAAPATLENSLLAVEWKGGSEGNLLAPVDPNNGLALPDYAPISVGRDYFYAFSPDRHTLAAVTFPNDNTHNGSLLLVDIPAWKTQKFDP